MTQKSREAFDDGYWGTMGLLGAIAVVALVICAGAIFVAAIDGAISSIEDAQERARYEKEETALVNKYPCLVKYTNGKKCSLKVTSTRNDKGEQLVWTYNPNRLSSRLGWWSCKVCGNRRER